jgi:hypothetical protein
MAEPVPTKVRKKNLDNINSHAFATVITQIFVFKLFTVHY